MKKIKLNIQLFGASQSISVISCTPNIEGNYSTIKIRGTLTSTGEVHNNTGGVYMKPTISNQPVVGTQTSSQTLSKKKFSLDYNSTVTANWTFKVYHKNNGSCNRLTISMDYYIIDQYSGTKSTTYTPDTIPRASTVSATDGTLNSSLTIDIARKNDTFVHTLRYECGNSSDWIKDSEHKVATQATWTPPLELANENKAGNTVQCKIYCQTYNTSGTAIGAEQSTTITLTIPTLIPQNVNISSISDTTSYKNTYGAFIQNKSKISATLSGTPQYSDIDSYIWQIRENNALGTLLASGDSSIIRYSPTTSGTLYIYGKITDKRGAFATTSTTVNVTSYSIPKCKLTISRTNTTTANYTVTGSGTTINNIGYTSNTITYTLKRDNTVVSSWNGSSLNQTGNDTILDQSYIYTLTAQDTISGVTDTESVSISTTFTLMNFNHDGTAMAIGKASETNAFEIALPTQISADVTMTNNAKIIGYQKQLTAGTNITIDSNNVISASGGGGGTATDVRINGTSITSNNIANILTESSYNASSNKIATMSDIPTIPLVPTKTSDLENDSDFVSDSSYVHTDNNYTSTEKTKLSGIASGAEVNVQSDWSQSDNTKDDYIKNKPTLSPVATQSTVGSGDRPVYLNSGTATQTNTPASGNYFRGVPFVTSGGVMEIGRYIDFHPTNDSTLDFSKRLDAGAGTTARTLTLPDKTGTLACTSDIPTKTSQLTNDSGFVTDISNKTNTSVLPNDNGDIKTKYRINKKDYTGSSSTIWYYPICELPADNSSNYASILISGRIGGWTNQNMSSISALVWNRNGDGISLLDIAGGATGMSSIWDICDIVLYRDTSNKTKVYLKCKSYFTYDLDFEFFQSGISILYDGNYVTTTPSGTLSAQASTSNKRVEIINSKLYVAGNEMGKKSDIPTNTNQLTNGAGFITSSAISDDLEFSSTLTIGDQYEIVKDAYRHSSNKDAYISTEAIMHGTSNGIYTPLNDVLDDKQDTLVSGTNIKTINSTSLLGSGNINLNNLYLTRDMNPDFSTLLTVEDSDYRGGHYNIIKDASIGDNVYDTFISSEAIMCEKSGTNRIPLNDKFNAIDSMFTDVYDEFEEKQDTLVSGTNIKTINNASILGSGNITIGGGGTATDVQVNGTSITSGGVANLVTQSAYNSSTNKIATKSDIPTNTNQLTNGAGFITKSVNNLDNYTLSSSLKAVATSGNYNDLSNKPTIPTVNNATLTIQKNSTTIDTFTANASSNKTINISVPTKLSDFETVLYNNATGTTGNVTLSDSASNYNYLEVFYYNASNDGRMSQKIYSPNGKTITLNIIYDNNTNGFFFVKHYSINGTTMTAGTEIRWRLATSGNPQRATTSTNITIYRVVGYK